MNSDTNDRMTIGQLAGKAGLSVETVRYYEREGLLPKPQRTGAGYRQYGDNAVARLRFIVWSRELGFSLAEVKELLRLSDTSIESPAPFQDAAMRRIEQIDKRIAELKQMRTLLADTIGEYRRPEDKDLSPLLALYKQRSPVRGENPKS